MTSGDTTAFFDLFRQSLESGQFHKATLSRPTGKAPGDLRQVFLRPAVIRGQAMVSWTWRYERRDEVKNLTPADAVKQFTALCGEQFRNAVLFTAGAEATLSHNRRGEPASTIRRTAAAPVEAAAHDRGKQRLINPEAPWLQSLGLSSGHGQILPSAQAKWRQINKFVEIIDSLHRQHPLPASPVIADMGCGKGYLTFALYDFLTSRLQLTPQVTGIEQRPELTALCSKAAQSAGFSGLHFQDGSIAGWNPARLDMLIALHACDTATDEAIAAGIRAGAGIIVVSPCCHKQVRQAMEPPAALQPVLRHGILLDRQAELLTDSLRALCLEAAGYRAQVFEFISPDHTARNLMITAVQRHRPDHRARAQITTIKDTFGIRRLRLEELLFDAVSDQPAAESPAATDS